MTRCKFVVKSVTDFEGGSRKLQAGPVYSQDPNSENKVFWEATPQGSLEISVSGAAAPNLDAFPPGTEFYVDLTPLAKA